MFWVTTFCIATIPFHFCIMCLPSHSCKNSKYNKMGLKYLVLMSYEPRSFFFPKGTFWEGKMHLQWSKYCIMHRLASYISILAYNIKIKEYYIKPMSSKLLLLYPPCHVILVPSTVLYVIKITFLWIFSNFLSLIHTSLGKHFSQFEKHSIKQILKNVLINSSNVTTK